MSRKFDPALLPIRPNLVFEKELWESGFTMVAGLDEAGRGALAGPVAAGIVILPSDNRIEQSLEGVRDSKQLTSKQRDHWYEKIISISVSWAVAYSSAAEIDEYGIVPATRIAMQRALVQLMPSPEYLLIDAICLPDVDIPQTKLIKGDARALSIASASILAKVSRDRLLCELDSRFPQYGFASHKGYGTAFHQAVLEKHGPCQAHRMSFSPLRIE
jgi:ribonuclease HII